MDDNYFTPFGALAPRTVVIPPSSCNPWTYRAVAVAWCVSLIVAVLLLVNLTWQVFGATAELDRQYALAERV